MLTAASLCFCKLLNPSASERLLISNTLEAKASLRLCLPRREIDIIVPIVFIVFIVFIVSIITIITIITIPPFYRFFPCNPCYPCYPSFPSYRRAFQADAFPFLSGWRNKKSRAKCLTPDYSFQTKAFPIILFRQKLFRLFFSSKSLSVYFELTPFRFV